MLDFTQKSYQLFNGDCLEVMKTFPDNSIDCVITDPPYGTTVCSWDAVIPFEPMWKELKRITKPKSAIVLFGSQPFTSALIVSNLRMFRYEWSWNKKSTGNPFLASKQPLKTHENICVFSTESSAYYPQKEKGLFRKKGGYLSGALYDVVLTTSYNADYFPKSVLEFSNATHGEHPTQKPVDLIRYLTKTYTLENEIILDFTMGSGTCGVACAIENRKFIGIEKDNHYFEVAEARIKRANLEPCDIPKRITNEKELPLFSTG